MIIRPLLCCTISCGIRTGCCPKTSCWTRSGRRPRSPVVVRVTIGLLHNHGHLHWRQAFEAALRCMFSTMGDYWRRMAHQHRRMPLTLCYR
jgi:hypothetical protein